MGRVKPNIKRSGISGVNHYSDADTGNRDSERMADESLNRETTGTEAKAGTGAVGSIRIVVDGESPYLEVMSSQGWVRSDNTSTSGFSFKK